MSGTTEGGAMRPPNEWITTDGGPFCCLPMRVIDDWFGVDNMKSDDPRDGSDYGVACESTELVELLVLRGMPVLVIDPEGGAISLRPVDGEIQIVSWIYGESVGQIEGALSLPPERVLQECLLGPLETGQMCVFDSAYPGAERGPSLAFSLDWPMVSCRVELHRLPDEAMAMLFRLRDGAL
ncbi:MAG: Imm21 family immunity protein [Planctomycetota bacterium]